MKIYLLRRYDKAGPGEARSMVVRAGTPRQGRQIAASWCGDEGREVWLDCTQTLLERVGFVLGPRPARPKMLCRNFRA
jgi:hypothetical protein